MPVIFPSIALNIKITGEKNRDNSRITGEKRNANVVAFLVAYIFGQISPNMSRSTTTTIVATETASPVSPRMAMETAVATDAARMLTILFPIRIVIKKRSGFFFKVAKASDPWVFSLTRVRTFALVIEKRATSEPEKKLDRTRHKMKIIMYT